jgi:hypothetical protein
VRSFPQGATVAGAVVLLVIACGAGAAHAASAQRDAQNVWADAPCRPAPGTCHSTDDGFTWTKASDVDIDHTVVLAQSGKAARRRGPRRARSSRRT